MSHNYAEPSEATSTDPRDWNTQRQASSSKRWMHFIKNALVILARFSQIMVVIILILALAYLLGRQILVGSVGNDSPLHIANAEWFDRFLPGIPNWFPLQGGGISIQRNYPIIPYLLVAVVHRILGLSLIQAYRFISFFSVFTAAVAVYLLCWGTLKNRTIGLIAAVFFLLSPVSWSWIHTQGYLATTVSMAILPLVLLCFERFLSSLLSNSDGTGRRRWFLGFIVSMALTTLTHVIVAVAAIVGIALYVLFLALVSQPGMRVETLTKGTTAALICGFLTALLIAFWMVPIFSYSSVVNPQGVQRVSETAISRPTLSELFSTKPLDAQEWGWYRDSSLPVAIGGLFVLGGLFAVIQSRKVLAIALSGVATIGYTLLPGIAITLSRLWSMSAVVIKVRSFVVLASVLFPVVAAYGVWVFAFVLMRGVGKLFSRILTLRFARNQLWLAIQSVGVSLLALVIMCSALYLFRNVSLEEADHINYGLTRSGIDLGDIWKIGTNEENLAKQLALDNWPPFKIAEEALAVSDAIRLSSYLPDKEFLRVDISPFLGRLAQNFGVYSNASQINTYIWNANLIWPTWGFQQGVFFIESPPSVEVGTPWVLNEVANWFGTEFVFLNPENDRNDIYHAAGWEEVYKEDHLELWRYPDAPELATLSARPKILVISREDERVYEQIFHLANRGGMPYEEFWLIQGRDRVDSYKLEELQQFDVLFLHGYTYRNSVLAWDLLEKYVRQGGALYVDTGWEWMVPEWEFLHAPLVLPVSSLKWTHYGLTTEYHLNSPEISGEIDPLGFSPLIWENGPWAVSGARPEDVREWGKVVLGAANQPLVVAGEYGEGRVVWSGMNLVAHSNDKRNDEEAQFLRNLLVWLTVGEGSRNYPVVVTRDHPDKVEFHLDVPASENTSLYWREAYYPAWHAYLVAPEGSRQELTIYRGGPGFMLIPIEGVSGDIFVELIWKTPLIERLASIISLLTAIGLVAFVIEGALFKGRLVGAFNRRLKLRRKKQKPQGYVEWLQDVSTNDDLSSEAKAAPLSEIDQVRDHAGLGGSDTFEVVEVDDEIGGREEVEVLWDQLTDAGKLSSVSDEEVERLMARWRRSRSDENG